MLTPRHEAGLSPLKVLNEVTPLRVYLRYRPLSCRSKRGVAVTSVIAKTIKDFFDALDVRDTGTVARGVGMSLDTLFIV
jgi:hypothetical protein